MEPGQNVSSGYRQGVMDIISFILFCAFATSFLEDVLLSKLDTKAAWSIGQGLSLLCGPGTEPLVSSLGVCFPEVESMDPCKDSTQQD